jgi:hypothetical protein
MKSILNKIKAWFSEKPSQDKQKELPKPKRETPGLNETATLVIGLIVGHEKAAPGASMVSGTSEYSYNSHIAWLAQEYVAKVLNNVRLHVIFRDGIGISGAYRKADDLKCDCVIELHFNSANKQATGSETLCSMETKDIEFASLMQTRMCTVFERNGLSRGVKQLTRSSRGGQSVYSFPNGVNCLVEPFFGDVKSECDLAITKQAQYAKGLIDVCLQWANAKGQQQWRKY